MEIPTLKSRSSWFFCFPALCHSPQLTTKTLMMMMPARRSSRLAQRRCSLQSLDADKGSDNQSRRPSSQPKNEQQQQQQQKQPRRSKRIKERNATKQSLPSSPVSTIDTPSGTDLKKMASISSIIITPNKAPGVRFGINSVAEFSGCDPPMHMERLPSDEAQELFPHNRIDGDDESSIDVYDDETKQNCHILAQWDDSFDEIDQIEADDDESIEMDRYQDDVEKETHGRNATLVVEEEGILGVSPYVSHRYNPSSRPSKRIDEYFCKSCGVGIRRISRYVYEDE